MIYLDYNATTPVDPAVAEAMLPWLREHHGNPSSTHALGKLAHEAVEKGRAQVAALLGAKPGEIVFTGGGTEASNAAIKGVFFHRQRGGLGGLLSRLFKSGGHFVTSAIEHPATAEPLRFLAGLGCRVTTLPVDRFGLVDPDAVRRAITGATMLVSIMHSNNEVGTLQPIREIGAICRERGVLFHADAAQSLGKVQVDVEGLNVDLLTVAGHKLYAPKGIGALYVRAGTLLAPLLHGAGHEGGRRAGTENVPYIVGLGEACAIARRTLPEAGEKLKALRDRLWDRLRGGRVVLNGHPEKRLPNTLNVGFEGKVGAELLASLPGLAASTGSACHEGRMSQSPVLCAMGVPMTHGAVRLTVGRFTTEDEVDQATQMLASAAAR
ncbi:MAG: cysteine desulfurase [Gemmataceae bacterium]|nr:cysteine desulfurase [Gemmataceae bacterium]